MKLEITTDDGRFAKVDIDDELIKLHAGNAAKARFIAQQCESYIFGMLLLKEEDKPKWRSKDVGGQAQEESE